MVHDRCTSPMPNSDSDVFRIVKFMVTADKLGWFKTYSRAGLQGD